jgi:DnaK suppressor protein
VSKPPAKAPAKAAAASKAPAKAAKAAAPAQPVKAAKPAPVKPTTKPAAKPAAKPVPKPVVKPAAKPVAKPAAKPVAKPATPPVAKPAVKPVTKPVVTPATKSVAKPVPVPTPAPAPAPKVKTSAKTAAARTGSHTDLPKPSPAPFANRFTDRFAPARPPARQMTEAADLPRAAHKADPKLVNAWKTKAGRDLTEPELLAMPDAEYMNEKQIDFFRAQLQKQKDDLLSNAGETTEHLREDTSIVPDPADRATIEEEHALELRTRDRERKLLKKIAQSLERLGSGEYGFCDETGEPIGLARLIARPTATLSLEAQQRRELKQKMFGD